MCNKCENGWIEVDPLSPEQADTPQYIVCECVPGEEDLADMSGAGEGERQDYLTIITNMKRCSKCRETKPLTEFYKQKTSKDGLRGYCKGCFAIGNKKWLKNNYNKRLIYLEKNRDKMKEYYKKYYKKLKDKNPEKIKEKNKITQSRWRKNNPQKAKERTAEWRQENPKRLIEYMRKCNKKRLKRVDYKISNSMRVSAWNAIKNKKAGKKWEELVGYTLEDLMKHLEGQFEVWMTWENYGEWEIDHVRPVNSFDITSIEDKEFKECWALENLQPLEKSINRKKYNKYEHKKHNQNLAQRPPNRTTR